MGEEGGRGRQRWGTEREGERGRKGEKEGKERDIGGNRRGRDIGREREIWRGDGERGKSYRGRERGEGGRQREIR